MDERIREALRDQADLIRPDVDTHLATVLDRGRRDRRPRLGPVLVAASAAIVILIVFQLALLHPGPVPGGPSSSPSPAISGDDLVGRYSVTLADVGEVHANGLGGTWMLELRADDVMLLTPPSTYPGGGQPLSGVVYSVSLGSLRTNLFSEQCGSVGVYGWRHSDRGLSFIPDQDDCDLRWILLARGPWQESR
jgi:hypothetical protein